MDSLPDEIVEYILKSPILSMLDVVHFSSTNSKFRNIVLSSFSIWKSKYFQRWPKTDIEIICTNWYDECIKRKSFEKETLAILNVMSSLFYNTDIKNIKSSQFNFVLDLVNSHEYGYYYLRDFLIDINCLPSCESLTIKYYGSIILNFINKIHLTQVWKDLSESSAEEQTLEKGAIFVNLWCKDNNRGISKTVTSDLDFIAVLARLHLIQEHTDHPLKDVSDENLVSWKTKNIPENMFSPHHCRSIIDSINYILFDCLKYNVMFEAQNFNMRKNLMVDALLERRAPPLILGVIYESVARRLGVRIETVHFKEHCLLRWKERYLVDNSHVHYISLRNNGAFSKPGACPARPNRKQFLPPCNMQQMAQTVASAVYTVGSRHNTLQVRDILELMLVMMPNNLEWYHLLIRLYMSAEMDARELISKLTVMATQMSNENRARLEPGLKSLEIYQKDWENEFALSNKALVVKRRSQDTAFAVGMIVKDKLTDSTGVICGWEKVSAPNCSYRYKVFGCGSSYHYVPQESLQILHSPPFISRPYVGRYFEEYCMKYYKPNKELQREYPEDFEALQKIIRSDRRA